MDDDDDLDWYKRHAEEADKAEDANLQVLAFKALARENINEVARLRAELDELRQAFRDHDRAWHLAEREKEAAEATVQRLRYVAGNYVTSGNIGQPDVHVVLLSSLRAALDGEVDDGG